MKMVACNSLSCGSRRAKTRHRRENLGRERPGRARSMGLAFSGPKTSLSEPNCPKNRSRRLKDPKRHRMEKNCPLAALNHHRIVFKLGAGQQKPATRPIPPSVPPLGLVLTRSGPPEAGHPPKFPPRCPLLGVGLTSVGPLRDGRVLKTRDRPFCDPKGCTRRYLQGHRMKRPGFQPRKLAGSGPQESDAGQSGPWMPPLPSIFPKPAGSGPKSQPSTRSGPR